MRYIRFSYKRDSYAKDVDVVFCAVGCFDSYGRWWCVAGYTACADSDNVFFSDFYSDASNYLYTDIIETLSDYVKFSDSYSEIDLLSIPVIKDFYIREWKD